MIIIHRVPGAGVEIIKKNVKVTTDAGTHEEEQYQVWQPAHDCPSCNCSRLAAIFREKGG